MLRSLISLILIALVTAVAAQAGDPFPGFGRVAGANFLEPTLGVGVNRIVQAGNWKLAAYDRSGAETWRAHLLFRGDEGFAPGQLFWTRGGAPMPSGTGAHTDVRMLYDQFSQRFVVVMEVKVAPALYIAWSHGFHPTLRPNDPESWDDSAGISSSSIPAFPFRHRLACRSSFTGTYP